MKTNVNETTNNGTVVPFTVPRKRPIKDRQRFAIQEFTNRSGSQSWRVSGYKRDGERIRENFADVERARARQVELETEYLGTQTDTAIRATKLTQEQLSVAEASILRLGDEWLRLPDAVTYWLKHGKHRSVPESPRLDDAVTQYLAWLDASTLREASKASARSKIRIFRANMPNLPVADIGPDLIEKFLDGRKVSAPSKDAARRNASAFFEWCLQRPRHWIAVNPCTAVRVELGETKPPEILSLPECERLMHAAERFEGGKLVPCLALGLFGGLRPTESRRVNWSQINLRDGEIRLEANQAKTHRARVVTICPALKAWLEAYKGRPFNPKNWQRLFQGLTRRLGYGVATKERPDGKPWVKDALRHTSVSHFFRKTGSYGLTAEQHGNSEAIIKRHYQGRVSSEDTARFYRILPTKRSRR